MMFMLKAKYCECLIVSFVKFCHCYIATYIIYCYIYIVQYNLWFMIGIYSIYSHINLQSFSHSVMGIFPCQWNEFDTFDLPFPLISLVGMYVYTAARYNWSKCLTMHIVASILSCQKKDSHHPSTVHISVSLLYHAINAYTSYCHSDKVRYSI